MGTVWSRLTLLALVLQCACARRGAFPAEPATRISTFTPESWPTAGWRETTPEEQGFSAVRLAEAVEVARARNLPIHSLLIVRHGASSEIGGFIDADTLAQHRQRRGREIHRADGREDLTQVLPHQPAEKDQDAALAKWAEKDP